MTTLCKRLLIFCLALCLVGSIYAQDKKSQLKNTHLSKARITLENHGKSAKQIRFPRENQPTVEVFFKEYRQLFPLSEDNRMQPAPATVDKLGAHHRYTQYYKGIEVLGAQYILHEKAGKVWHANGHLVHGLELDVTPAISEPAALQAALNHVGAASYMWEKAEYEAFIKREQKNEKATFFPRGELKLTSGRKELAGENIRLVYRFDIYAETPRGRYYVDVDAKSGEIVNQLNRIHDVDVTAANTSYYDGVVNITVDDDGAGTFTMQEHTTRGVDIETFDMMNGFDYSLATIFSASSASGFSDPTGVSAHFGAEATFDYYLAEHGRNSYDNAGGALLSYVHFGVDFFNAFWDGTRMTYGDGILPDIGPLVSLDVVGHELTHGVTEYSSNLIYAFESGALNESFSDIFGNVVEFSVKGAPGVGTGSWRVGEEFFLLTGTGFRNMADPNELGQPDTYKGDFWFIGIGDNGGVHTNSGVQNFWFYLLSEGGSGVNDFGFAYSVTGIGIDKAADIAYHNNNSFLTPGSNYDDARNGAIACAEALFGVGSPEAISTADAWDAVGVDGLPPVAPDNDDCANALAVTCGSLTFGTTLGATFDAGVPFCDFDHTAPGVWYTVEGTGETLIASMCSFPVYDARLTVYEGSCESFVCVGANDDFCAPGGPSQVTWPSVAGVTYYLLVHGFDLGTGDFELAVNCVGEPQPAIAGVLYGSTGIGGTDPGSLFTIDLATGAATLIGASGQFRMPAIAINSAGEMFGSSGGLFSSLLRIDAASGFATIVAPITSGGFILAFIDAIAFDENDQLYAIDANNDLYTVDVATGEATFVGSTGVVPAPFLVGMTFEPGTGRLFASTGGLGGVSDIYELDPATGVATLIGGVGLGGSAVTDLHFVNGTLYGSHNIGGVFNLISIDTGSGAGTVVGPFGADWRMSGLAFFKAAGHDFLFLAQESVELKHHTVAEGDIHSNNFIEFQSGNPSEHHGNASAVGEIEISKHNTIFGDVTSGAEVDLSSQAVVTGTVTENALVDAVPLPVLPAFTPGAVDQEVPKGGSLVLAPGDYGEVKVQEGGSLFLSSGTYNILRLDMKKHTLLEVDVLSGAATINIAEDLDINKDVTMRIINGNTTHVTFNVAGSVANKIRDRSIWLGNINAPNAGVVVQKDAFFKGVICAWSVEIQQRVTAVHHSSATPVPSIISLVAGEGDLESITAAIPTVYALEQNYPNPFNPTTTIRFALPEAGNVSLKIFNIRGQLVRTLANGNYEAGYHNFQWDAANEVGEKVASGIYFYQLIAKAPSTGSGQGFYQVKKMVLMK